MAWHVAVERRGEGEERGEGALFPDAICNTLGIYFFFDRSSVSVFLLAAAAAAQKYDDDVPLCLCLLL